MTAKRETVEVDREMDELLIQLQRAAEDVVRDATVHQDNTVVMEWIDFVPLVVALSNIHRLAEKLAFGQREQEKEE